MRDLYVVAVSEDGRHVVLAGSKAAEKGTYRVRLDARLVAAVRGDLGAPAPELSPKEIQARLRAGESAEQIARSGGMALTRVERFAGPVAGEMARMIAECRDQHLVRGRRGPSAVPLGRAVDDALGAAEQDWTTRREEDGRWRVQVGWTARGRRREAAWSYEPHEKSLVAVDPASAALGHVDDSPAPKRAAAPRATPARTRTPPPAKATRAAAPRATPAPAKAKRAPAPAPAPAPAAAKKPVRAAKPARSPRPRLQVVPDPPTRKKAAPKPKPRPATAKAAAADVRDGVRGRASVPGWADVLLGTTPSGPQQ